MLVPSPNFADVRVSLQANRFIGETGLNLRPPDPQPEAWGVAQLMEPMFTGVSASECL
jgi:hypothetical protein